MSTELRQALEQVARRHRHVRLWSGLALCWLAWALVGLGLWTLGPRVAGAAIPAGWLVGSLGAVAASGLACAVLALRSVRDPRWVARRIEARHPELGTGLLAAVEQVDSSRGGRLGYLQTAVISEALEHRRSNPWEDTVSPRVLQGLQVAHAACLSLLLVVCAALVGQARARSNDPLALALGAAGAADVQVDPGNTELERGTSLLVVARFRGAVPAEANLVVEAGPQAAASEPPAESASASRAAVRRAMTRSLEDPTFAGRVESVDADLAYRVEYQGRSTPTYRVRVFEYPELQRTDARLVFPGYTGLASRTVEDIRHVTAVEGTELTLLCHLNKDVSAARLVDEHDQAVTLAPAGAGTNLYRATFTLADSKRYRVQLVDREGRRNKLASEILINVTRNRPAVVRMTQPAHDVRVSPIEELRLKADLEDDFGVVRHGISYTAAGQVPRDLVLSAPAPAAAGSNHRVQAEHLLDFEALQARPDELVTYVFWAEDIGPDGRPRRSSGDMFFAEVRHFEEIFRQGEQPPGGSAQMEGQQGQNARESDRLAELQKQIINGTWKLVRRETGAKPSAEFAGDGKLLEESQHSAIEQAGPLAERLRDPASKASLEQAVRFMKEAQTHLGEGARAGSVASLTPALAAEQTAYQALLKLRAREFQVIRNNSRQRGGGGGGGGGPSQRQLQQLELSNEENRYEEQRSARPQSQREQEQREIRQVSNRLRELAQRQTDLNDRLKELQSALEEAKTPQAREEIERQLKRLRDQQQQILRDTDELRERMEREENRDRMAEARQQIEQGREHVRQASEALEQGRLSQAITEGARAGRQLNDLRDQVRKQSADRFSEEMTEMRQQARRLDEDQDKLTEQLEAAGKQSQRALRDNGQRQEVRQGLEQQEKRLDQLLDRMRNTVQEAEESEPLLAKGLYDTVRKAGEQKIPDALKVAEQLTGLGVTEDAARASRHAGQGLEQLRQGVERAAESVLGDETAALRRAQDDLDDLADQVNREIAQATGQEPHGTRRDPARQGRNGPQGNPDPQQAAQDQNAQPGQDGQPGQPGLRGNPQPKSQPGNRQGQQGNRRGQPRNPQGQPGNEPGQREGQPGQRGNQQGQQGNQEGQQQGQQGQQGQRGQQGQQGGQQGQQGGQQGQQGGQPGQQGQQGGQQGQQGQQGGQQGQQGQGQQGQGNQQGRQAGSRGGGGGGQSALDRMFEGLTNSGPRGAGGPITGEGFRQWSDRMREVEELLEDPGLRADAARIRDRVRGTREEFKRHSKVPDWNQLQTLVAEPIQELRNRIGEEIRRRESPDALVPIDRDPVPPQFAEGVRRYYERLGSGR